MGERALDPRLEAIKSSGANIYSYSKLSTIDECAYDAYLTYVKHDRGIHNIYDIFGTCFHDKLEEIINGTSSESDLMPVLRSTLDEMDMIGIDFPKDYKGGSGIRDKWISNMELFCRDFTKPQGRFKTEQLLILKLNDKRYLQGYADLIKYYEDGSVQVLDWKTSSQFKTEDLLHYGRQLVAYSMALEQEGYVVKPPAWIMLKYVQVSWSSTKTKGILPVTKICDRCKLAHTIAPIVKDKMHKFGYNEESISSCLDKFQLSNSLESLPNKIKNEFEVKTYVREYKLTDDIKRECIDYINRTADKFEAMQKSGCWYPMNISPQNEFKCINLCSHRKDCFALKKYLESKNNTGYFSI